MVLGKTCRYDAIALQYQVQLVHQSYEGILHHLVDKQVSIDVLFVCAFP
jgi:hypothetical protein